MKKIAPYPDKFFLLTISIGLSILIHILVLFSLGRFGDYDFSKPVNQIQAEIVDLVKTGDISGATLVTATHKFPNRKEYLADEKHSTEHGDKIPVPSAVLKIKTAFPAPVASAVIDMEKNCVTPDEDFPEGNEPTAASPHVVSALLVNPPLRTVSEFLQAKTEKLSYLISLMGVPVGSMELEAKNKDGEVFITLRTRSNSAMSNVYPVDDFIETRHIAGNFIITKVRKHEGAFKSDIGFTIFLRDKRVFWIDNIRKRYSNETIPNDEVLDTLSSFYYLRNRPLQIGKTELLHIYDGDTYAPVLVEVLRQEQIRLRNLTLVDTILLRHIKQKNGNFKRTGDMLIWLTKDEYKVPVKIETYTPLGQVTVELVSAETEEDNNGAITPTK